MGVRGPDEPALLCPALPRTRNVCVGSSGLLTAANYVPSAVDTTWSIALLFAIIATGGHVLRATSVYLADRVTGSPHIHRNPQGVVHNSCVKVCGRIFSRLLRR